MDRPDSRRVLDNLIMVKQINPMRIFLGLALDEGNADYLADTEKKRDEKEEKDTNLYTWIFSVIFSRPPCSFWTGLFIIFILWILESSQQARPAVNWYSIALSNIHTDIWTCPGPSFQDGFGWVGLVGFNYLWSPLMQAHHSLGNEKTLQLTNYRHVSKHVRACFAPDF